MRRTLFLLPIFAILLFADPFEVDPKVTDTLKKIEGQSRAATPEQLAKLFGQKIAGEEPDLQQRETIFYLFSTGMGKASIENFMDQSAKVAKEHRVRFFGVIRGFPEKSGLKAFFDGLYTEERKGFSLKMHPAIFKAAGITRVPAYLFATCPSDRFRFRECRLKYLVKGDIPLSEALKIAAEKDRKYDIMREAIYR